MMALRQRIHDILDGDPLTAPPLARAINTFILVAIVLSVSVVIIESYQPIYEADKQFLKYSRLLVLDFSRSNSYCDYGHVALHTAITRVESGEVAANI